MSPLVYYLSRVSISWFGGNETPKKQLVALPEPPFLIQVGEHLGLQLVTCMLRKNDLYDVQAIKAMNSTSFNVALFVLFR